MSLFIKCRYMARLRLGSAANLDDSIQLVDLADGLGPRIGAWDEAKLGARPTEAELAALETDQAYLDYVLAEAQMAKLAEIRAAAQDVILAKWPLWMQSNIALGLDTDPLAMQCKTDIANVRTESNGFEADVTALTDPAAVAAYAFTFTPLM